jgi:NADPH:quinone reductase-like Zn-dependent oxidoreductase
MLITRARLHAGEDVLVLGAGSGVGQAAIPSPAQRCACLPPQARTRSWPKARQLGREVINHSTQDLPAIREFTNGRGVDMVFEHVGTATWGSPIRARRPPRHLRATTGHDARIDLRVSSPARFRYSVLTWPQGGAAAGGSFSLPASCIPIKRSRSPTRQAQRRLEAREQFGKFV